MSVYDLNDKQEKLLKKIYYKDKMLFGRDKLFAYLQENYPEYKISRRMLMYWLKKQEVYQINYRSPKTVSSKSFTTRSAGYLMIDLVDMSSTPDHGFYWIFTAIDIFTKKAVAFPMKNKTQKSVNKILNKLPQIYDKITIIQSDNGPEFRDLTFFEDNDIKHVFSKAYTPQSQGFIEKFNGTLKTLIAKNQQINNNTRWVNDLPTLLENYNDMKHATSEQKPNSNVKAYNQVKKKNPILTHIGFTDRLLDVGSKVRVKLKKSDFDKKFKSNYTKEIYTIAKVFKPKNKFDVNTYKLIDSDGDYIEGVYNASELLLAELPNDIRFK